MQEHQRLVENEAFILEAIDLVSRKYPDVKILESNWWDVELPGWALEHAAVTETSLMTYLRPDPVREEYIPGDTDFTAIPYHKYPVVKGMVPDTGALASARGSSAEREDSLRRPLLTSSLKSRRGNTSKNKRTGKFSLSVLFMC